MSINKLDELLEKDVNEMSDEEQEMLWNSFIAKLDNEFENSTDEEKKFYGEQVKEIGKIIDGFQMKHRDYENKHGGCGSCHSHNK